MIWDVGLSTVLAVAVFALVVMYRFSYLHKKKIWNLSVQQMINLVVVPGIIFPFIYAYLRSVETLPRNPYAYLPDALLVNIVLLSFMFTYGGMAIHAVTKMLSEYLRNDNNELAEVNRFFHLQFSHTLSYAGALAAFWGLVILELSHVPATDPVNWGWGVIKAVGLGLAVLIGLQGYTRSFGDDYQGRWRDLKLVFLVFWIGFILFLLGVRRIRPELTDYQLLLPAIGVFGVMVFLSTVLVIRRVGRKWQVRVKRKSVKQYLRGENVD